MPVHAHWVGGTDGGVFVVLTRAPVDRRVEYDAEIYHANGEVWFKGKLVQEPAASTPVDPADSTALLGWDGEKLLATSGRSLRASSGSPR